MIRDQTGCHTAIIHHTGKDTAKGARGSNAQVADVDTEFTITGSGVRSVKITKGNDQPEGNVFCFSFESAVIGHDEDGDPITVGIPKADEDAGQASEEPREWTGTIVRLKDAITDVLADGGGFDYSIPRGPTVKAVHLDALRTIYRNKVVAVNPDPKRPYKKADNALAADIKAAGLRKLIATASVLEKGLVWIV
jgi:hypothetical protein